MAEQPETVLSNPETDFEREDWNLAIVGALAIIVFAFLLLIPLVLHGAYFEAVGDVNRKQRVVPPPPLLQTDPATDLNDFRAEEKARLNSYGWVDRAHGIVHIPIAEAMKQIEQKGAPGFPQAPQ